MKSSLLYLVTFMITILLAACQGQKEEVNVNSEPKNPLLGSWEMKKIHWITTDTTYTINQSQPGLFLVTPNSYSIMWTPTPEPRVPFEVLSQPTDEELKAGFRSIVFNGGSYEINDSTFTTTALVAKVPGFEGGKQFYNYSLNNNQLTLTMYDETYPDGKKPEWFGRLKTKFVLTRVE